MRRPRHRGPAPPQRFGLNEEQEWTLREIVRRPGLKHCELGTFSKLAAAALERRRLIEHRDGLGRPYYPTPEGEAWVRQVDKLRRKLPP